MKKERAMTPQQAELYARLSDLPLDPEGSTFSFTARLAEENGWSAAFARRAVHEYRRFLFIAAAAGHPVSPSDEVDQVWHLHILHTRSYWDDLCGRVLGRPLHHEPTRGGAGERAKFADGYARTLDSYRRFFGEEPPRDLWPTPEERARSRRRFRRVDVAGRLRLPRPRLGRPAIAALAGGIAVLLAGGCASSGSLGPLDLPGPEFLLFYSVASLLSLGLAHVLRPTLAGPAAGPSTPDLDPYEIAALSGGADRAVEAAVVALVDQGGARVDPITHGLRRAPAPPQRDPLPGGQGSYRHVPSWEAGLPPLELVVYRTLREDVPLRIDEVTAAVRASTDLITGRLMRQGLVFDEGKARRVRLKVCATALAIPAALGLSKLLVGLSRGEPVVLLVLGMAIVAGLAYWQFKRPPLRTRAGDEILARLQSNHQDLRAPGRALSGRQAVMSVALFGAGILAGSVLGPVAMAVAAPRPPAPGSGGAHDSGYGSSCGGSSCGGSSDSGGSDSGGSDSGGDGGGSSCGGGGCGGGGGD